MNYWFLLLLFSPFYLFSNTPDSLRMAQHLKEGEALYYKGGNMDSVLMHFEHAAELSHKHAYWEQLIYTYLARYNICNSQLLFDKAETFAFKGFELAKLHLDKDHRYQGSVLNNLSVYYAERKNYNKAIELSLEELEFQKGLPPNDHRYIAFASILGNLGAYWSRLGDHKRAIASYEEAIQILQDSIPDIDRVRKMKAFTQWELAFAYYSLKEYQHAERYFLEGISYLEKHDPKNYKTLLRDYQSLANLYLKTDKPDKSLETLEKAKLIQEKYKAIYGKMMQGETFYITKGKAYTLLEKYDEAQEFLHLGIREGKKNYQSFKTHSKIGLSYKALGDLYSKKEEWIKAVQNYQKAIYHYASDVDTLDYFKTPDINKVGVQSVSLIELLRSRTIALKNIFIHDNKREYLMAAWETALLQLELIDRIRKNLESEGSQLFLSSQAHPSYEQAINIALQLYEETHDDQYQLFAYSIAEKNKSVLLFSSLRKSMARLTVEQSDSLIEREASLSQELSFYKNRMYETERKKLESEDPKLKTWKSKVFSLQEELLSTQKLLKEQNPAYFDFAFSPSIESLTEIREKLTGDQGLVEYFWGDSAVFIFYIDQKNLNIRVLNRNDELDSHLQSILTQLHSKSEESYDSFVSDASYLYNGLLAPEIRKFDPEKLKVVPDGPLGHLSFDVLLPVQVEAEKSFRSLPYLGQMLSISYAYSASLMLMNNSQKEELKEKNWLGFAPSFSQEMNLSFNTKEVEAIRSTMERGVSFLEMDATAQAFKTHAPKYHTLHLSTHGFPEINNPAFARLVFSSEDGENDTQLYAHELAQLPLNADLAVLSACESGYGEWARGEGIMSLARAFRFAGCKSILSSLWKAEGAASKELMEGFYGAYADGLSKDDALQKAKVDFLASASPNQVHPKHWANFVLIGDVGGQGSWWSWWWLVGVFVLAFGGMFFNRRRL